MLMEADENEVRSLSPSPIRLIQQGNPGIGIQSLSLPIR